MEYERKIWFHCGKCGALFLSRPGMWMGRRCPDCHKPPGESDEPDTPVRSPVRVRKTSRRKSKASKVLMAVLGGWTLLLILVVVYFWPTLSGPKPSPESADLDREARAVLKDQDILREVLPSLQRTLMAFLSSPTPEGKAQFVDQPGAVIGKMVRFYESNPGLAMDVPGLQYQQAGVLHVAGHELIETRWLAGDQRMIQAVFRKSDGEYRLDWLDFVRYSDAPATLFFAGDGEDHGEFRLLARERKISNDETSGSISVVFYEPDAADPRSVGRPSVSLSVDRNSPEGRLLEKAFRNEREGKAVFGSPLPKLEPEGLIRVRVKLSRSEIGGEKKFSIDEVSSVHWLNIPETGAESQKSHPE
ncbi:MAG: hypothetical protein QM680_10710 [Luteolibacter sp.]